MDGLRHSDPRSWSIEQVIFEICQNDRPPWVRAGLPNIPAKQQLDETLRSNHIDGELLLELSPEDLKNELNIKSLGQRKAIEKAIRFLRGDPQLSATPAPFSGVDRLQRTESWIPTPSNSRTSYAQASPAWELLGADVTRPSLAHSAFGDSPLIPSRENLPLIEPSIPGSGSANSNIKLQPISTGKTSRPSQSPVRRALPPPNEPFIEQHNGHAPNLPEKRPGTSSGLLAEPRSSGKQESEYEHGLLDQLEAHINDGLQDPSDTQEIIAVMGSKPNPKEKQRVTPTLIGPVRSWGSQPLLDAGALPYLEAQAFLMQDTFYGESEDDDRDFSIAGALNSPGNILVVARRVKRFLRSRSTVVPGLGYDAVARIPYLQQHCEGYSRSYFTLFAQNVPPSIQELKDWAPLLEAGGLIPKHRKASASALPDPGEAPSQPFSEVQVDEYDSDLGDFAYLLDKYPVAANEDSDLLPAYGDSGDENEYDEETWAEIAAEKEGQKASSSFLSNQEATLALDKALDDIREEWRQTKLPRVQMKAYRLWMKVAKARKRQNDIAAQYAMRNRKLAYLEKLKYQVLRDKWRNADQLRHQCEALKETVHQIMEAEYLLTVLHSDTAPQKPSPEMIKKQPTEKSHLQEDEEVLDSDSDLESQSPMDGFVIDNEGDTSMIMGDDPVETDFNPIISPKPSHSRETHASEDTARVSPSKVLGGTATTGPTKVPEEPAKPDLTEPDLPESPADDADAESNASDDDEILASIDKRQIKPRKLVTSEDWSSSSRAVLPDSDDGNSDFDAPSRLPPSKWQSQGRTVESAIELLSSDPPQEDESTGGEFNVETPPLNPPDSDGQEPDRKPRITLKLTTNRSSVDDDRESSVDEARARRVAALKTALDSCSQAEQHDIRALVRKLISTQSKKTKDLSTVMHEGLMALHSDPGDSSDVVSFRVPGLREQEMRVAELLTVLLVCYINEKDFMLHGDYSVKDINVAFDNQKLYRSEFQADLLPFLDLKSSLVNQEPPQSQKKPGASSGKKRKRSPGGDELEIAESGIESDVVDGASDANGQQGLTPHAKKKKKVALSKQVRDTQKDDQLRVQEQEARRQVLLQKMQRFDTSSADREPVNTTEPLIYLDDHIAARVKPHQVTGIQFLWREIVDDPRHQGCLLAHTMGLGKTMQVISLLVTIAQSIVSLDSDVVDQVPKHLRESKTLILCPPSLIDNWYDELLMWSPPDDRELLGMIVKISAGRSPESLTDIRKWASQGGVLIMSYDTFRSLLVPRKNNMEHQGQVPEYEDLLLKTPSLVVADEAHKLKNAASKISLVTRRFKTLSRIALTGSPLNNHLEEYHTMVEWIAPNYLGDMAQFRSKYVDPITAGLYADSTAYERRHCLRKLHVLKKDLEPKVNRADITAIRNDMPPKTEYIITIPLAEQQRKAYDLYVMALLGHHENSSGTARTTLFKWLNKLTVLANHPSCFIKLYNKYEEILEGDGYQSSTDVENQTEQQATQALEELTESWDPLDVKKVSDFDTQSMKQAVEVFREQMEFHSQDSPELSLRTDIARKILQKAVAAGEKTLVFSQSIPTLDYLEQMLRPLDPKLMRIDGGTAMSKRQKMTKDFNRSDRDGAREAKIILISTRAGGLGLNLQGANRVIIFDSGFNPMWEEQAVGRAYRLGQTSPVFVYRFKCGGTFEEPIYNKALFKTQLFQRVVDKKNPTRAAEKSVSDYLFPSKDIKKQDFSGYIGRDPNVLDAVLGEVDYVHNIELTETFQKDDGEELNEDELKQADVEYKEERLRREDPAAWQAKQFPRYPSMNPPAGSSSRVNDGSANAGRPADPNGNARRGANGRQEHSNAILETHGTRWLVRNGDALSSDNPAAANAASQQLTGNWDGLGGFGLDWQRH